MSHPSLFLPLFEASCKMQYSFLQLCRHAKDASPTAPATAAAGVSSACVPCRAVTCSLSMRTWSRSSLMSRSCCWITWTCAPCTASWYAMGGGRVCCLTRVRPSIALGAWRGGGPGGGPGRRGRRFGARESTGCGDCTPARRVSGGAGRPSGTAPLRKGRVPSACRA